MKLLVLGHTGMVGHVMFLYLKENNHDVTGIEQSNLHDIDNLSNTILTGDFDAVINCTAVINQFAEEDKAEASFINAYIPHLIEKLTEGTNTIIVHRSTDCVFSGSKGGYTLSDIPDAQSFYARTKAVGEIINNKDITIRTSLVGPEQDENGISLLNWFLKQRGDVNGFANAIWTGLTTIEFAKEVEYLIRHKAQGLFHTVPDHGIGKYDLLKLFAKYIPGDRNVIRIDNKLVDKSLAQTIGETGLVIPDYEQQIEEMAEWIKSHSDLYPSYYR